MEWVPNGGRRAGHRFDGGEAIGTPAVRHPTLHALREKPVLGRSLRNGELADDAVHVHPVAPGIK
jgi:hypothetical protein